jgi:hypothetical protein
MYAPGLSVILLAVNARIDGLAAWRFVLKSTVAADVQVEIGSVRSTPQGCCWWMVCCRLWTSWRVSIWCGEDHPGAWMLDGRAWVMMMSNTRNVGHGHKPPISTRSHLHIAS